MATAAMKRFLALVSILYGIQMVSDGYAATKSGGSGSIFRNQKVELPKASAPPPPPTAQEGGRPELSTFSAFQYEIEDLQADVHEGGNLLNIVGKIRNHSHRLVKGTALVHFQDRSNGVIGTVETEVNNRSPLRHGESGAFDVTVNIAGVAGISNVTVEFIERP